MPAPSTPASTCSVVQVRPCWRAAITAPAAGSAYTTTGPSGVEAMPVRAGLGQPAHGSSDATVCTSHPSPFGVAAMTCCPVGVATVAATHGAPRWSTVTEGHPRGPAWLSDGSWLTTCWAAKGSGPLAYQMPSGAVHTTCTEPSAPTATSVPLVLSVVASWS